MKQAKHSTALKPTLRSVNADIVGSWFSSSLTSLTPWITSLHSPFHKSMPFCKSTTVMTVALNHYMKLNTIRTISYSVKTDNSCFVQIYCIATYKITNTGFFCVTLCVLHVLQNATKSHSAEHATHTW